MGLDGTAPGTGEELRFNLQISHGIVNAIHAGFQGKLVAISAEAQLGGRSPDAAEVNVLKAILGEIRRWDEALWQERPLVGREGVRHPSPDAPLALELMDELRADLLAAVKRVEAALASSGRAAQGDLVSALLRYAYTREHFVQGLVRWGERFGPPDVAERHGRRLTVCRERTAAAHGFLNRLREGPLDRATAEELHDHALLLPGAFRARVHDLLVLVGLRRGSLSFRILGVPEKEARAWKAIGVTPEEAGYWRCHGFDPAEARAWSEAGFDEPLRAAAWRVRGFDLEAAVEWHNAGCTAPQARVERAAQSASAS